MLSAEDAQREVRDEVRKGSHCLDKRNPPEVEDQFAGFELVNAPRQDIQPGLWWVYLTDVGSNNFEQGVGSHYNREIIVVLKQSSACRIERSPQYKVERQTVI